MRNSFILYTNSSVGSLYTWKNNTTIKAATGDVYTYIDIHINFFFGRFLFVFNSRFHPVDSRKSSKINNWTFKAIIILQGIEEMSVSTIYRVVYITVKAWQQLETFSTFFLQWQFYFWYKIAPSEKSWGRTLPNRRFFARL